MAGNEMNIVTKVNSAAENILEAQRIANLKSANNRYRRTQEAKEIERTAQEAERQRLVKRTREGDEPSHPHSGAMAKELLAKELIRHEAEAHYSETAAKELRLQINKPVIVRKYHKEVDELGCRLRAAFSRDSTSTIAAGVTGSYRHEDLFKILVGLLQIQEKLRIHITSNKTLTRPFIHKSLEPDEYMGPKTLVAIMCSFKNPHTSDVHAIPYIRMNNIWYIGNNNVGVLIRRTNGPPTWDSLYIHEPQEDPWHIEFMELYYVDASIVNIDTPSIGQIVLKKTPILEFHGRPIVMQTSGSCYSDSLYTIITNADGLRQAFYNFCNESVSMPDPSNPSKRIERRSVFSGDSLTMESLTLSLNESYNPSHNPTVASILNSLAIAFFQLQILSKDDYVTHIWDYTTMKGIKPLLYDDSIGTMTSVRRPSISGNVYGDYARTTLSTLTTCETSVRGPGKTYESDLRQFIFNLNGILNKKDAYLVLNISQQIPSDTILYDSNSYTLVGIISLYKKPDIKAPFGHAVAYVKINGIWYQGDNDKGVLLKRTHGKPTINTKYASIWNAEQMLGFYIRGDIEVIPLVESIPGRGFQGMVSFLQSTTACWSDSLQTILWYADGYRSNIRILYNEIFSIIGPQPMKDSELFDKVKNALLVRLNYKSLPLNANKAMKVFAILAALFVRTRSWESHPLVTHIIGKGAYHELLPNNSEGVSGVSVASGVPVASGGARASYPKKTNHHTRKLRNHKPKN